MELHKENFTEKEKVYISHIINLDELKNRGYTVGTFGECVSHVYEYFCVDYWRHHPDNDSKTVFVWWLLSEPIVLNGVAKDYREQERLLKEWYPEAKKELTETEKIQQIFYEHITNVFFYLYDSWQKLNGGMKNEIY